MILDKDGDADDAADNDGGDGEDDADFCWATIPTLRHRMTRQTIMSATSLKLIGASGSGECCSASPELSSGSGSTIVGLSVVTSTSARFWAQEIAVCVSAGLF